jgi:UDP-N-acetylmuramate dehydrogenase
VHYGGGVQENVALARYTTIGTGGPARWFAEPSSVSELQDALRWARDAGVPVEVIGLGSNLLVADEGVDALVLRLRGELAGVRIDGDLLTAGGGATNAVCLHRARAAGLGGFEFASAIPGTAGGGVRMNAGAYAREWRDVLVHATIVGADGVEVRDRDALDLRYRRSNLRDGEVVAEVVIQLEPRDPVQIKSTVAQLLAQRKSTQPTNKRTFGSVFKNPGCDRGAGALIEATGLKAHRIGGAVISPRHANFIENIGDATSNDARALMIEARRRVHETFGIVLEHEVRLLGALALPPL